MKRAFKSLTFSIQNKEYPTAPNNDVADASYIRQLKKTNYFRMNFILIPALALALIAGNSNFSFAKEKTVMVGGAAMYPSKNIVENALNSKDHTTLVAAVKAAGLVETLEGDGPFTVFAPTNEAFNMLPKGTVETLLKPENKGQLTAVLTYQVVAGNMGSKELMEKVKAGNGMAMLTTVQGEKLTVMMKDNALWIKDAKGGVAKVSIKDVNQKNGVIHVIDHVLLP